MLLHSCKMSYLPFPKYRRLPTPLQQTTFENSVAKLGNCSFWAIYPSAIMFSNLLKKYSFIYRDFSIFLTKYFRSRLLKINCMCERFKHKWWWYQLQGGIRAAVWGSKSTSIILRCWTPDWDPHFGSKCWSIVNWKSWKCTQFGLPIKHKRSIFGYLWYWKVKLLL